MDIFSEAAQAAIAQNGVTRVTDLHNFTLEELKSEFKFTMLDVLALRKTKQNKRARTNTSDDPSDASSEDDSSEDPDDTASSKKKSKNLGGGVFAQLMDSCVRELLPSRWDGMEALGLRSAVVALAPQLASAHIHLRAEVDFLLDLIVAMKTPEESNEAVNMGTSYAANPKNKLPTTRNARNGKLAKLPHEVNRSRLRVGSTQTRHSNEGGVGKEEGSNRLGNSLNNTPNNSTNTVGVFSIQPQQQQQFSSPRNLKKKRGIVHKRGSS